MRTAGKIFDCIAFSVAIGLACMCIAALVF